MDLVDTHKWTQKRLRRGRLSLWYENKVGSHTIWSNIDLSIDSKIDLNLDLELFRLDLFRFKLFRLDLFSLELFRTK